jgi:hypothetical protein
MYLEEFTGRGVRVAVVDSGVHAGHPHVGGVDGGIGIAEDGAVSDDFVDVLGHGTAVTAAIREKAPDASLVAVKVFWRQLSTGAGSLAAGIEQAGEMGAHVINLSLGTANTAHRPLLEQTVARVGQRGAVVVAALEDRGMSWLPGGIPGVIPVCLDWECDRGAYRLIEMAGRVAIAASGYPRDIPGVPRERNLKGISFAVANASGFVARALQASARSDVREVLSVLQYGLAGAEMRR